MICESGDVALVPFPFVDTQVAKVRPALVLSIHRFNADEHQSVLAMITTAAATQWRSDYPLQDWSGAGLRTACVVRLKLFTLENRLIKRRLGRLGRQDWAEVRKRVASALDFAADSSRLTAISLDPARAPRDLPLAQGSGDMRAIGAIGVTAAAGLVLAACHPARIGERRNEKPLLVSSQLICPESQGELTRSNVAGDGLSCSYTDSGGTEVQLQLVALNARPPQTVLADLEAQLKAQVAIPSTPAAANPTTKPSRAEAAVDPDPDVDADEGHGNDRRERTRIDLPGFHVDTEGDHAQVNLPGMHINADDGKAEVQINKPGGGSMSVHADERGAEIRDGGVSTKNVDATYILATKNGGGEAERSVGYVARGPVGGPLVIARVTRDAEGGDRHDLFRSVRKLVSLNVGRSRRA